MNLGLPDEEMRNFENHIAQGGYSHIIVCEAVRHPEEAMLDSWVQDTKIAENTTVFALVPGESDYRQYMELDEVDVLVGGEAETIKVSSWEAVLESTLAALCADAVSPEIQAVKSDLYKQRERLIPFIEKALVPVFAVEEWRTRLLLDGQDLISVTTFPGTMERLANSPKLPGGDYETFLALLRNHNPYVVKKKRDGTPYRALVNILFAVEYDASGFEPGLSILPIESSGHHFRSLLPSVIVA
jgi:hypothetical protein